MIKKFIKIVLLFITDKQYRTKILAWLGMYDNLSDEDYIKKMYYSYFGEEIDLNNPKTFNEKLQWLKLNDRNSDYVSIVDKYEIKKLILKQIGEKYVVPTYGVWDSFDEINFDLLPNRFVLKTTHDSGCLLYTSPSPPRP